jgi:uncharacterized protein
MRAPQNHLVAAVTKGDIDAVRAALTAGASADERGPDGRTALMLAAQRGDLSMAQALLDAGASPNRRTSSREETVLHLLARDPNCADMLRTVATERARVERRDRFGWTPLMVAAHHGCAPAVTVLLAAGADPASAAPDGSTPSALAEAAGHTAIQEQLGAAGTPES